MARLSSDERELLVSKNLRIAYFLARKFDGHGMELEDLEQEAALGLCAAALVFDPAEYPSANFGTYARDYVKRYLTEAVARHVRFQALSLSYDVPDACPSAAQDRMVSEVWDALEILSPRERMVVVRRFGLDGGPPSGLLELSFHFGIPVRSLNRMLCQARATVGDFLKSHGWTQEKWAQASATNPLMRMA